MAIYHFEKINEEISYLVWYISEPVDWLYQQVFLSDEDKKHYTTLKHYRRKQEWLSARIALQYLLHNDHNIYRGLYKGRFQEPYLCNLPGISITLSHSFPFAVAMIHKKRAIGGDIQVPKTKLYVVGPRFLNHKEEDDCLGDLTKICIYWCAKESVYKLYPLQQLSFKYAIQLHAFKKNVIGYITGKTATAKLHVYYRYTQHYILAWCTTKYNF